MKYDGCSTILFATLGLLVLAPACSNLTLQRAQDAYRSANLRSAQEQIDQFVAQDGGDVDRVIAYLEQGTIRRSCGDLTGSNSSFQITDETIERLDEQPDVSLSKEALAIVTNLNALPYKGFNYDRIMLNTYQALNYLELGKVEAARVELRQAYNCQREAAERNAHRIEAAEDAARQSRLGEDGRGTNGYDVSRAMQDQQFQDNLQPHYARLDKYRAYADYVNPFAEWLQGVFFMAEAADDSDLERARKSMERVLGMVPDNAFIREDAELIDQVAAGGPLQDVTYVVFSTGTAPTRDQIRIDIPLFLVSDRVSYVGASFPKLVMNDDYMYALHVRVGANNFSTDLLCDMDSVVAQEFKNGLPVIITKTLIATGTKALMAHQLKKSARDQHSGVSVIADVVGSAWQFVTNEADLRTWSSIPKQFQYARFPTPQDGRIELNAPGAEPIPVQLIEGSVNVVMVRSINSSAPLLVSQFLLGKGAR